MSNEAVITILAVAVVIIGILTYLAKKQFDSILGGIQDNRTNIQKETKKLSEELNGKIKEIHAEMNRRMDSVEEKALTGVGDVEKQVNELKASLPMVYTLREDFIRNMNNMEKKMNSIDAKIDKLLEK